MRTIKKQKPKMSTKRMLLIAGIIILGCGLLAGGWYFWMHTHQVKKTTTTPTTSSTSTVNYGPATNQEKQESTTQKQQAVDNNTPPSGQSSTTPTDATMHVVISRANQTASAQPLNIRTVVTGTSTGQCVVAVTKDGQPTVNQTFSITLQATYETCASADIPASAFSVAGDWNLSVTVQNGSAKSTPATTTVTIEK